METNIVTASLWGLDAETVTVETVIQRGLPMLQIVGLPDETIREAKERVKSAIFNSEYDFPMRRVTINLSPADVRKEGSQFDLPIAVSVLAAEEGVCLEEKTALIGEMSLDGRIKKVRGVLPLITGLKKAGIKKIVIPEANEAEASIIEGIFIYVAKDLKEAYDIICGRTKGRRVRKRVFKKDRRNNILDYKDVAGQEAVKRALTVAAAGGHGILMIGPPGVGKTMMARRLPGILPPMTKGEIIDATKVYSAAGMLNEKRPVIWERPFVSPHYTVSKAALIGGGMRPRPGEISLAHRGILFLDELGQFEARTIELLRQPIEDGAVEITRTYRRAEFPCRFMLIAASNPCKCGYLGDSEHECTCTQGQIDAYRRKFSGPVLDRIDMHIKVYPIPGNELEKNRKTASSEEMRFQVEMSRQMQEKRMGTGCLNGRLTVKDMSKYCVLGKGEKEFMKNAYEKLGMSMRAYNKVIKIARTVADIEGSDDIRIDHLAEAIQYRDVYGSYREEK